MTDASNRKEGFKKCRSATFSIDGYSFTIGENFPPSVVLLPFGANPLSGGAEGLRGRAGPRGEARRGARQAGDPGRGNGAGKSRVWPGRLTGAVPAVPLPPL